MRKKEKALSMLLILSLLTAGLSGCGKKSNEVSQAEPADESSSTIAEGKEEGLGECTLKIWGGVEYENGIDEILEGFMEKYPQIKVEYTRYTNDEAGNTKLDTALLTGEQIDVYFTYSQPNVTNRVAGGMAVDLGTLGGDKYIEETIGTEGVFKVDGKYYSLPTAKEPTCMMINKDLFDEAGIPVPEEWTIDEFREIAKKINNPDKGVFGVYPVFYDGLIPISTTILGSNAQYTADGTGANFTAPEFEFDRLSYDLLFTDQSAFPYEEIVSKQAKGQWNRLFASGNIGIAIFQPWMCNTLRNKEEYPHDFITAFAPMPVPEKGKDYYNIGTLSNYMMINSKSKYQNQAWELLKYWVEDGIEPLLPFGKVPVNKNYSDPDMAVKILQDPEGKTFDAASFERAALDPEMKYVCNSYTTAAHEISQILKEEVDRLLLGSQTYEEYLGNVQERCDAAIKEAGK